MLDTIKTFLKQKLNFTEQQANTATETWVSFNIDQGKEISRGYAAYDDQARYLIKVANNVITELYRQSTSNDNALLVGSEISALDINTLEEKEYYRMNLSTASHEKYDVATGEKLQDNFYCSYETLPEEFKVAVQNQQWKDKIFLYAIKPYGRIVEYYL